MTNAGQARFTSVGTDSILKRQVSALNIHFDAVAVERDDAVSRKDWNEIALPKNLRYGLRSCHWSSRSLGGQGLSSADNRRQARSDFIFLIRKLLDCNFTLLGQQFLAWNLRPESLK